MSTLSNNFKCNLYKSDNLVNKHSKKNGLDKKCHKLTFETHFEFAIYILYIIVVFIYLASCSISTKFCI